MLTSLCGICWKKLVPESVVMASSTSHLVWLGIAVACQVQTARQRARWEQHLAAGTRPHSLGKP